MQLLRFSVILLQMRLKTLQKLTILQMSIKLKTLKNWLKKLKLKQRKLQMILDYKQN